MRTDFEIGQDVFVPALGIAKITAIGPLTYGGVTFNAFHLVSTNTVPSIRRGITKDVPVNQAHKQMLPMPTKEELVKALPEIAQPSGGHSGLWSKRANKYEALLKEGGVEQIAHVYRKTKRDDVPERSYAENLIFQEASALLGFMTAYVLQTDIPSADKLIQKIAAGKITVKKAFENAPEVKKEKPAAAQPIFEHQEIKISKIAEPVAELPLMDVQVVTKPELEEMPVITGEPIIEDITKPEFFPQLSLREAWDREFINDPMSVFVLTGHVLDTDEVEEIASSTPLIAKSKKPLLNIAFKPITISTLQEAFEYVSSADWIEYAAKNLYLVGKGTAKDIREDIVSGFHQYMSLDR